MNIYISYSSNNVEQARKLAAQLQQESFIVLYDKEFLEGGQVFNVRIEQMLRGSDIAILLLTQSARDSRWVNEEFMFAINHNTPVIPVKLEKNVKLPFGLQTVQYVDMSDDNSWTLNYPELVATLRNYQNQSDHIDTIAHPTEMAYAGDTGTDPFVTGSALRGELFVGRTDVVRAIVQRLTGPVLQSFSIVANRRMGKTSLFKQLVSHHSHYFSSDRQWVFIDIDMMSAKAHTPKAFMHTLRRQLEKKLPVDYLSLLWNQNDSGELLYMVETLENLYAENVATVLLLDEWEEAHARPEMNQMVDTLRSLGSASNVALVTATSHELISLYYVAQEFMENAGYNPADTSAFANIFRSKIMGAMPDNEWQQLVQQAFERRQREVRARDLTLIGELAGGHPYLTQLAGSIVWKSIDDDSSENQIRQRFFKEARPVFMELWHKITIENQKEVLKHVLDIEKAHHLNTDTIDRIIEQLTARGVLKIDGSIFSTAYANFINDLVRNG
jgi:hypothetical protein